MDAGTIAILLKAEDQASKVMNDAGTAAGGLNTKIGDVARTAGGFVIGNALTDLPGKLLDMAKGAADDEASMGKLKTAVENAEGSYDNHAGAIDELIKKGQELGFSDDDTRDSLALMTATTGDADEAMRRLGLAQDLSRGTGMDLVTASKLLGRVNDENISVLSRYGIQVDKNATSQDLLNAVDGKFSGQAATFAGTDAGKLAVMTDKAGELQEQLGGFLIPVLGLLITAGVGVIGFFSTLMTTISPVTSFIGGNLVPIFILLAPLLAGAAVVIGGVLVSAFIGWAVATWAQVAASLALNASMLPIIAVLVGIGLVIAGLYLAWSSNFLGIRDITDQVLGYIGPYVQAIWDGIQAGVSGMLSFVTGLWGPTWTVISTAVDVAQQLIGGYIASMTGVIQGIVAIVSGVIAIVKALLEGDFSGAWDAAKTMVSGVIGAIGTVVSGLPATIAGYFADMATQAGTALGGLVTDAATKAGEVLSGIVDGLSSLASDAGQKFLDLATGAGTALGGIVTDAGTKAGEILSAIVTGLASLATDAGQKFLDFEKNIGDTILRIIGDMPGKGAEILNGLVGGIAQVWSNLTGQVDAIKTMILNKMLSAASWLVSTGSDIVNGLIDGIKAKAQEAADAAIKVVKDAIDAAKEFLHINSPSLVAHQQLGSPIGEGIVAGLLSQAGAAEQAAVSVVQGAIDAANGVIGDAVAEALAPPLLISAPGFGGGGNVGTVNSNGNSGRQQSNASRGYGPVGEPIYDSRGVIVGFGPSRGTGGTPNTGQPIQQTINVTVEDRSPAAIANAVKLAGVALGQDLQMQGVG